MLREQINKFDWDLKRKEILDKTNNDPEEIKKYVLNEKNTKITKKYIEDVLRNYGIEYEVYDIAIFHIAMTHPSYTNKDHREMKNLKSILMGINFLKGEDLIPISEKQKHMAVPLGETSYERLEFLGDSILRQIISDYLFTRYNDMDEGDLTKLRSQIENGSSLAEMTRRIGLHKYLLIPRNLEVNGAREKNNKFQCDIFEAIIAAVYYDSLKIKYKDIGVSEDLINKNRGYGYSVCFKFVTSLIEDEIDLTMLLENETNHKDELLQIFHKLGWGDPKYNLMDTIINNDRMGKKYFKMYVRDNEGKIIGIGIGSSKQKGEKIAAKKALQYLKVIPNNNEDIILDPYSNEINYRDDLKHFKKKLSSFKNNNLSLSPDELNDMLLTKSTKSTKSKSTKSTKSKSYKNYSNKTNNLNKSYFSDNLSDLEHLYDTDSDIDDSDIDDDDNSNIDSDDEKRFDNYNNYNISTSSNCSPTQKIKLTNLNRNICESKLNKEINKQSINPWARKKTVRSD